MSTIDKILQELEPYKDKVITGPMTEEEIAEIRSKFKRKLPNYYLEFLRKIGLKQNLVWGLLDRPRDFMDLEDFLGSGDYFRFGHNGGEDYWLLKFENESDRTIYECLYYREGEIVSLEKTFDDLLKEACENTKENYDQLPLNSEMGWYIQFSANTGSAKFLVSQLKEHLDIPIEIIKEPEFESTSLAGVKSYKGIISIANREIPLSKQVISGSSTLFFNWRESQEEMKTNSILKKIDRALSQTIFQHTMGDYTLTRLTN